jgi:hypothetical protein
MKLSLCSKAFNRYGEWLKIKSGTGHLMRDTDQGYLLDYKPGTEAGTTS